MLLHNTITGVIAAVMVALGAGQIGNTSTQVGEELVVEETVLIQWFEYTGPELDEGDPNNQYDPHNPENYSPYQGSGTPTCSSGSQVCAIQVGTDTTEPQNPIPDSDDLAALEEDINSLIPRPGELMFKQ